MGVCVLCVCACVGRHAWGCWASAFPSTLIRTSFLPDSQTPDHLPRRTCPRIPQSWQSSASNKDHSVFLSCPSIKLFTCWTSIHKSCFLSLYSTPNVLECVCVLGLYLDIMGGDYIQRDRARNNPTRTQTTSKLQLASCKSVEPKYTRWNVHFYDVHNLLFLLLKYQVLKCFFLNWIRVASHNWLRGADAVENHLTRQFAEQKIVLFAELMLLTAIRIILKVEVESNFLLTVVMSDVLLHCWLLWIWLCYVRVSGFIFCLDTSNNVSATMFVLAG